MNAEDEEFLFNGELFGMEQMPAEELERYTKASETIVELVGSVFVISDLAELVSLSEADKDRLQIALSTRNEILKKYVDQQR
jgi:hypothetical protein